jgi:hypothetical protein
MGQREIMPLALLRLKACLNIKGDISTLKKVGFDVL